MGFCGLAETPEKVPVLCLTHRGLLGPGFRTPPPRHLSWLPGSAVTASPPQGEFPAQQFSELSEPPSPRC